MIQNTKRGAYRSLSQELKISPIQSARSNEFSGRASNFECLLTLRPSQALKQEIFSTQNAGNIPTGGAYTTVLRHNCYYIDLLVQLQEYHRILNVIFCPF